MIILPDPDQLPFYLLFVFFRCNSSICDKYFKLKMVLDYEYGINTGNRFLDLVDHDEDPEDYIAKQTQPEEKPKKTKSDTKPAVSATSKKSTTTTTTTTASTANASGNTARTNKENLTGKSANNDQRKQQTNVLIDNNNQQIRGDSARGKKENILFAFFFY
jgi:hypothetical protein